VAEITKRCSRCKKFKPLSEFHYYSRSKDGRYYYCKICKKILGRAEYQRNKETYRQYNEIGI
jgi:phage FluMu protein Com